jgi:serine/threonine-protein kinase
MSDDETTRAQARVGTTLRGKYRLDRLLGVGAMAAVYAATQTRVGHRVALKVLHPHTSINADIRARFLREGYVANTVGHRGAVRVTDDDTAEDGSVFLAMELLEGETLDARWQRSGERLPVREVAELTHQLLDVLAAAHEKGIVHRDIKPENLFLTNEGTVKVLDFGIARLASTGDVRKSATRTGRMLGSPAFMSPEQALGKQKDIDGQTDLWSAGATMFTLITGQFVHDAETVEAMLVYAGSRPARPLRTVAPEVPAAIAAVVDRALASAKAERWGSARAMEAALEAAYFESFREPIPGARLLLPAGVSRIALERTADLQPAAPPPAPNHAVGPTLDEPPNQEASSPTLDITTTREPFPVAWRAQRQPVLQVPLGVTTTAGIESEGQSTMLPVNRRSKYAAIAGAIVFAGLVVILAWASPREREAQQSTAAAPSTTASANGTPPVLGPTAMPPPSAIAGVVSAGAADAGTVSAPDPAVAKPNPSPRQLGPQSPVTPRPAPLPVVASSRPTPTPTPSCTTITEYDQDRQPHFKSVCH